MRTRWLAALVVVMLLAMTASAFALDLTGSGVEPVFVPGNPKTCDDYKIDPVSIGTSTHMFMWEDEEVTVEINVYWTDDGYKMNFQVLGGYVVYKVIAKGSNAAYIYDYTPDGIASDTGLYCPIAGGSGKYAAFSHISFCFGGNGGGGGKSVLSGSKWYDLDMDGVWDDTEDGIEGWRIELYQFDADEWVMVDDTITNAAGGYSFADLEPGTYRVVEGEATGCWKQTYPYDPNYYDSIVLAGGLIVEDLDFGNVCVRGDAKGYTMGFWSNKNGSAAIKTFVDGGGVIEPWGEPMTQADIQALFRQAAKAVDMCVMLKAQYAAHWLSANVPVGEMVGEYAGGAVLIDGEVHDYDEVLAAYLAFDCEASTRAEAEWFKDFFDGLNNNWFTVVEYPGGCEVPIWD